MNPLLLLLLLPNKQAQTQISWFYYLFNSTINAASQSVVKCSFSFMFDRFAIV